MALIHLIVFGGFACLFPLATYCLVLAGLNGRRRPIVVAGTADFAGLLAGTSGFLIVGGPLILVGIHETWRRQALRGTLADIRAALAQPPGPWLLVWVTYFVLVVAGVVWLAIRRRSVAVIYNIDPTDAQKLLPDLLTRSGLPWTRRGGTYSIGFPESGPSLSSIVGTEAIPVLRGERAVLDVTVVPGMRHVTLRWRLASADLRGRVEDELRTAVTALDAPYNPIAGWLIAAATGLFAFLLILLGLFVALVWSLRG